MQRHQASFRAEGDDGESYVIHVFEGVVAVGSHQDPNATVPGLRSLRTAEDQAVNRLDQGVYQVVATGVKLQSDDPNAP